LGLDFPENGQVGNDHGRRLDQAIADARVGQNAHFDAAKEYLDSQTLRLEVLRLELADIIGNHTEVANFIDLKLVVGKNPKLWIDMTAYVVMEPSPRHFRLMQDRRDSRSILFETDQRPAMVEFLVSYVANRLVERDRELSPVMPYQQKTEEKQAMRYSSAALVLAWFSGLVLGVIGLFLFGIWYAA
jgi:hypothetical protein